MAKDTWLTEAEICDQLESGGHIRRLAGSMLDVAVFRERPVFKRFTPDFTIIEYSLGDYSSDCDHTIGYVTPVEVKITATADAIIQLANYHSILENLAFSLGGGAKPIHMEMGRPILIARYFDQKIPELMSLVEGGQCYKIVCDGHKITGLQLIEPEKMAFHYYVMRDGNARSFSEIKRTFPSNLKVLLREIGGFDV